MNRLTYWHAAWSVAIGLVVGIAVGSLANHGDASDAIADDPIVELSMQVQVLETETERLICAVAVPMHPQSASRQVAISCVPKIPGLFEEPVR